MPNTTYLIKIYIRQLISRQKVSTYFILTPTPILQNQLCPRQRLVYIYRQILRPRLCTKCQKQILISIHMHIISNTQYSIFRLPEMTLQKGPSIMYFPQMFKDRQLLIRISQQLIQLYQIIFQLDIFFILLLKLITQ